VIIYGFEEVVMGVITIRCPRTGMQVSTGLETDEASFEAMPSVGSTMHCPACGAEHVWSKNHAKLVSGSPVSGTGPTGEPTHPA
jgi:hypothetical protein